MALDVASLMRNRGDARGGMRELTEDDACTLFAAMLGGRMSATERRGVLAAFDREHRFVGEAVGCLRALAAHGERLDAPADRSRPVVLAVGAGTRTQPNLTALVSLLLTRYGVPVLMHGGTGGGGGVGGCGVGGSGNAGGSSSDGSGGAGSGGAAWPRAGSADGGDGESRAERIGRISSATILRTLGVLPVTNLADAQSHLVRHNIAYVPTAVLVPGLAPLLADLQQAGDASLLHSLAALIDPFRGDSYRVVGVAGPEDLPWMREILAATAADALLLCGTEGEPFADPRLQATLEHFLAGRGTVCADAEAGPAPTRSAPSAADAVTTAAWIAQALAGEQPLPASIVAQLGCCLNGARRRPDDPGDRHIA